MITADQKSQFCELMVRHDMDRATVCEQVGMSQSQATVLMKDTEIRALIRRKLLAAGATDEQLQATLADIILADYADYDEVNDGTKTLSQLRESGVNTSVVKGFDSKGRVVLYDKVKAIESVAKMLGIFGGSKQGNTINGDVHVHGGTMQQAMPEDACVYDRLEIQADIIKEAVANG